MAKMTRTQIHLGADELEALDRESAATGASRSELIRRLVRERYVHRDGPRRRPTSIGMGASGRIDAADDEEWLRAEWDRLWPRRRDPAA